MIIAEMNVWLVFDTSREYDTTKSKTAQIGNMQ